MALLGFGDLKDTALHSLWDTSTIVKDQLADGTTFAQMVGDVQGMINELNNSLLSMPHYSGMFAIQDEPTMEYPVGVSNGFEEATEYSVPDPRRGLTTGHMLPLKEWDRSLGWTIRYLRKARMDRVDADVRSVMVDGRKLWQQRLLTRFFSSTANTVGSTSSADVPFADAGSADSNYVPPDSPDGEAFTSSHEHFLDYGDTGITQDTLDNSAISVALEHLQEHGHEAPFDLIGARTDAGTWAAVEGWKSPNWPQIAYHASAVERALGVADIGEYFGYVETDYGIGRVWLTPRLPTLNFGAFKSYGPGDQRNPLRVRIDRRTGFGFRLVEGNFVNAPMMLAMVFAEFGVGVGDRVNGVAVDLQTNSWAAPTIS